MKLPKVTIMIPTYNQEQYISEAIESALAQDYSNLEIVISDDCSTDNTKTIVDKYITDKRVKYFRNEKNLGRIANYRKLIYDFSSGEWIMNLDGDNFLIDKNYISYAFKLYQKYNDVILISGGLKILSTDGRYRLSPVTDKVKCVDGYKLFLNWINISIPHLSALFKRDIAINVGFHTEDIMGSDFDSLLKLILNGNVLLIDREPAVWRIHGSNASANINLKEIFKNSNYIISPYKYALNRGHDIKQLDEWKHKMLKKYFSGVFDRILLTKSYNNLKKFYIELEKEYPALINIFYKPINIIKIIMLKTPFLHFLRNIKWLIKYGIPAPKDI